MDARLKQDINHLFSVFQGNVLSDIDELLPPDSATECYQVKFEEELSSFHAALMHKLEREIRY